MAVSAGAWARGCRPNSVRMNPRRGLRGVWVLGTRTALRKVLVAGGREAARRFRARRRISARPSERWSVPITTRRRQRDFSGFSEKALAIHVADRDRLAKRHARTPH